MLAEDIEKLPRHKCCEMHIKSISERMEMLEGKLLMEIERRENEYNELLHILLSLKKQKMNPEAEEARENSVASKKKKEEHLGLRKMSKNRKNESGDKESGVRTLAKRHQLNFKANSKQQEKGEKEKQSVKKKSRMENQSEQLKRIHSTDNVIREANSQKEQQFSRILASQIQSLEEKIKRLENSQTKVSDSNTESKEPREFLQQQTLTSILFDNTEIKSKVVTNYEELQQKIENLKSNVSRHDQKLEEIAERVEKHETQIVNLQQARSEKNNSQAKSKKELKHPNEQERLNRTNELRRK